MRKLKYLMLFGLSMTILTSCFEDADLDLNDDGFNVAGFENATELFAGIADGSVYSFQLQAKLIGPTVADETANVEMTLVVGDESTAIEGTHFAIENKTITLSKDNNYLGAFEIDMLTEGIETPLDESPVLQLFSTTTGSDNVTGTGKPVEIVLNYACPSYLAGTYDVVTVRDDGATRTWQETITETGIGEYLTQRVGLWDPPLSATFGFPFNDLCGVITVPQHNLADIYSNQCYSHLDGTAENSTFPDVPGEIVINYTIEFSAGNSTYQATYTPVD